MNKHMHVTIHTTGDRPDRKPTREARVTCPTCGHKAAVSGWDDTIEETVNDGNSYAREHAAICPSRNATDDPRGRVFPGAGKNSPMGVSLPDTASIPYFLTEAGLRACQGVPA